jgi:Uma2 family endonuclease
MHDSRPGLGPLSVEEYLNFENGSTSRHEFVAGRMYALAGNSARHNLIASNICARLQTAARGGPCQAYIIDLKVRASHDRIYYPDGIVACLPHDDETHIIEAPCLIIEVTSRATRRIDRGEKLDAYLAIPSLRGYLIAEHDRRHVTLYSRPAGVEWRREEIVTSGSVALPCPVATLSLDDVYDGIEMSPLRVREDPEGDEDWLELEDLEPVTGG